jgi:hypothetical protein
MTLTGVAHSPTLRLPASRAGVYVCKLFLRNRTRLAALVWR